MHIPDVSTLALPTTKRWYGHLYAQVLMAIAAGVALGHFAPDAGEAMKPLMRARR